MNNNQKNSVRLEGLARGVNVTRLDDGSYAARVGIVTMHPRGGLPKGTSARGSDGYEYINHEVRISGTQEQMSRFISLEKDFSDAVSNGTKAPEVRCSVEDGSLKCSEGKVFVEASPDAFKTLRRQLKTENNNTADIEGRVLRVISADDFALLEFEASGSRFMSFISRKTDYGLWKDAVSGQVAAGDSVSFKGSLIQKDFSNGKRNIKICVVAPREMSKLNLVQKAGRKSGPSL